MKISVGTFALLAILILSDCQDDDVKLKGTKLAYYTETFDIDDFGFTPQFKVVYEYQDFGKLNKYTFLSYNPDTDAMEEQRFTTFSYKNGKVDHINGYAAGATSPYVEYAYLYLPNGDVSRIAEDNHDSGVASLANFVYSDFGTIKVTYTYSNGGSFDYEFEYTDGNILTDKTTRGFQLCSGGKYTYDQNNNPFKNLGYVDYNLTNMSTNNKLTSEVHYVGCAFPTLIPESFSYEYNEQGYPTSATTTYKSQGTVRKSRKEFFYN